MTFVHIADLHLGGSFKSASFGQSFGNIKRETIKKNLRQVIEYIKDHKIQLLLIAGDFLEGDYIETRDLLDLNYLFELIKDTHIVMMAGNHDPITLKDNPYNLINWPDHVTLVGTEYESIDIDNINTSVISVSWHSKGPLKFNKYKLEEKIKASKHKHKIVMLHGDIYTQNDYFYMDVNDLLSLDVDYIALGHIHKPDIIKNKIAYPGSLEPLDFSENESHGFIEGSIVDGVLKLDHQRSMILPMLVIDVDVTACESYLEIVDKTKNLIFKDSLVREESRMMLRIYLKGEKNPYIGNIEKQYLADMEELLASQCVYVEVKDKTTPAYDIDILYSEHEDDIIGHFIRSMREKGLDNELHSQALSTGLTLLLEAMR